MRIIIAFLFLSICSYGQLTVGYDFRNNQIKNYNETLEKFKSSETIFIFSNLIEKSQMEEFLKHSWSFTPFKVVSIEDFNIGTYLDGNYSFATYNNYEIVFNRQGNSKRTFNNYSFNFFLIDKEKYLKTEAKNKSKKNYKFNKYNVFSHDIISLGSFFLNANDYILFPTKNHTRDKELFLEDVYNHFYNSEFFYDNNSGFLQNNLQLINYYFQNNIKVSPLKELETLSEIQKLKSEKLVIPYEVYVFYDIEIAFNPAKENDFSKLKKDYNYDYQVLKSKEISDKILKGEEFHFIRYTLIETEKIIQIVNSKTGKVIYSKRFSGMRPTFPEKAFIDISKDISK